MTSRCKNILQKSVENQGLKSPDICTHCTIWSGTVYIPGDFVAVAV